MERLHTRNDQNVERQMEIIGERLNNKLEHHSRNIKNGVDLTRIKLLEKIAKLEVFSKQNLREAISDLRNQMEKDFEGKLWQFEISVLNE